MGVLDGIRVMEFSTVVVGPLATTQLALMGAEVIKIESRARIETSRKITRPGRESTDPDASPEFIENNLGKFGITLDFNHPKSLEVAKSLVSVSDVLVENFAAGVIDKFGLGYDVVKAIKPDIIMVSASGSGATGPEAGIRALAQIFGALSGLADMTGYPDQPPSEIRVSGDSVNSFFVVFSILSALWHRKKTGQGQYIDYSSREGLSCIIGDSFMDYTMNSRVQTRNGNRDDIMAPHNCYRCKGEDKWVSIAIANDKEWLAFCDVIGNPEWTKDEKFSTVYSRWQNQEEMDKLVTEWTVNHTHYEVMDTLQKAGVAAVPSFTAEELYGNPHLAAREFTEIVEHPKIGAMPVIRSPWRFSATPPKVARHAPLIGEHNEYVFGEILEMSKDEIAALEKEGVFW